MKMRSEIGLQYLILIGGNTINMIIPGILKKQKIQNILSGWQRHCVCNFLLNIERFGQYILHKTYFAQKPEYLISRCKVQK